MPRFLADKATADKRVLPDCGKKPVLCDISAGAGAGGMIKTRLLSGLISRSRKMNAKLKTYVRRMGLAAFLFFLLKGLGWLLLFYFGWQMVG